MVLEFLQNLESPQSPTFHFCQMGKFESFEKLKLQKETTCPLQNSLLNIAAVQLEMERIEEDFLVYLHLGIKIVQDEIVPVDSTYRDCDELSTCLQ